MGTLSSLIGARLAQHSVAVPPMRSLEPVPVTAHAAVALPVFRTGEAAGEYVADPMPTLPPEAAEAPAPEQRHPTPVPAPEPPAEVAETLAEPTLPEPAAPSPGTYVITRSVVDAVANDPESVGAQSTHIAVERAPDGSTIGLRITGVGRDSALRDAGIRNGDVLVAVNGETVDSPQRGVAMYQRLSTSSGVSVELLRRGERRRIRIEVTDSEAPPEAPIAP